VGGQYATAASRVTVGMEGCCLLCEAVGMEGCCLHRLALTMIVTRPTNLGIPRLGFFLFVGLCAGSADPCGCVFLCVSFVRVSPGGGERRVMPRD